MIYRKIWGKKHPECGEFEYYLGNFTLREFEKNFHAYSSARLGEIPYDENTGEKLSNPADYLKPVFLGEDDYQNFLKLAETIAAPRIKAVEILSKGGNDA